MTASFRLTITALPMAFAALLPAVPLHAQNSSQPAQNTTQAAPAPGDTIGPSELRDFNLGSPTRRNAPTIAPPLPSARVPQTSPAQPSAAPSRQPPATRAAPAGPSASAQAPVTSQPQPQPQPRAEASPAAPDPSSSVTFDLPSSDSPAAAPGADSDSPATLGSQPGLVPVTPPESASIPLSSGPPMWPWLLAALLAGVGALYYGKRQRLRRATAGNAMPFEPAQPVQQPPLERAAPPAARAPRPVAAPPPEQPISSRIPGRVVSTKLRPQLEIQFIPERLFVDTDRTVVRFAAMILNSGNAPALDILIEAAMFNAGPNQDEEIGAFFAHPRGLGDRVPQLLPLNNMTFRSEVVLPTSGLRLFEIEGRKLFVPLVGFNVLYRWGGKDAQTSESFVVGVDTQSEKMGPFRIESAPRQFRTVAARAHSVRLRK